MSIFLRFKLRLPQGNVPEVFPLLFSVFLEFIQSLVKLLQQVVLQFLPADDRGDPSDGPSEPQVKSERQLIVHFLEELHPNVLQTSVFDVFSLLDLDLVLV